MLALFTFLTLGGCQGTSIETVGEPPFELKDIQATLWVMDADNDNGDGEAVLLITEGDMSCSSFKTISGLWDFDELIYTGDGLVFVLAYDSWGARAPTGWEGLWMSGYAYDSANSRERAMYSYAFSEGFLYRLSGYYSYISGNYHWLEIASVTGDEVSGTFQSGWWSGSFAAENCGTLAPSNHGNDTGYYSAR